MLNRRHIRIKVLHSLYAYFQSDKNDLAKGEKELLHSLDKVEELYVYLFDLLAEVHYIADRKIEDGKKKRLPTEADLNPNTKFVDNKVLKMIRVNKQLKDKREFYGVSWNEEMDMLRGMFDELRQSDFYETYMEDPIKSFEQDKDLVVKFFKKLVVNKELLQHHIEESSIYWIDDLDLVASMIIKTIKKWNESEEESADILPLYRDKEDKDFAKTLFRKVVNETNDLDELIKQKATNWELERIALMDMLVMKLALTEAKNFKNIPIKVTMNEFIELSKFYSTPKSKNFINGILDGLFEELKASGEIQKSGRGLIG